MTGIGLTDIFLPVYWWYTENLQTMVLLCDCYINSAACRCKFYIGVEVTLRMLAITFFLGVDKSLKSLHLVTFTDYVPSMNISFQKTGRVFFIYVIE